MCFEHYMFVVARCRSWPVVCVSLGFDDAAWRSTTGVIGVEWPHLAVHATSRTNIEIPRFDRLPGCVLTPQAHSTGRFLRDRELPHELAQRHIQRRDLPAPRPTGLDIRSYTFHRTFARPKRSG